MYKECFTLKYFVCICVGDGAHVSDALTRSPCKFVCGQVYMVPKPRVNSRTASPMNVPRQHTVRKVLNFEIVPAEKLGHANFTIGVYRSGLKGEYFSPHASLS